METSQTFPAKISFTGGSSFLNSLILKRFTDLVTVKEIHVFDIQPPEISSKKVIFHRMDITKDKTSIEMAEILKKNNIQECVHGALFSSPTRRRSWHHEVESIGTYHVLNATAAASIKKLLILSSTFVYGADPKNPNFISESFPLKGAGPYFVKVRVDVENQIQEFIENYPDAHVTVLRLAPILGPNANSLFARYFTSSFAPKVLGYDPLLQFVHEEDALRAALIGLSTKGKKGIFNIVGKGVIPLSTAMHLSGTISLPILSNLCSSFFTVGSYLKIWNFPKEMAHFLKYLCIADGKKSQELFGFFPKYSSRQALKSMLEANRLRSVGFSVPSTKLGEEQILASVGSFERVF